MENENIIISHDDDPSTDTIMWNKDTVTSQNFQNFVQKKLQQQRDKELKSQVVLKRFNENDNYVFVELQTLCNAENLEEWTSKYLETIGLVKFVTDSYRLYPLGESSKYIKLKFSNFEEPNPNTYARIFGYTKYNDNQAKTVSEHSKDAKISKECLEIHVNILSDLDTLKQAQHMEKMLCKVNYYKLQL